MSSTMTKDQIEDLLINVLQSPEVKPWKGDKISFCCTVHGEKNPSAGINVNYIPEGEETPRIVYHCFSCLSSGSIPWLVYKSLPEEFKSMKQAEKFLKERYGVSFSTTSLRREEDGGIKVKRYDDCYVDLEPARRQVLPMYKLAVFKSGKETYQYFYDRGFSSADLKEYKIGRDLDNKTVTIPVFWETGELAGVIGRFIDDRRAHNSRYRIYDFEKSKLLFPLDKLKVVNDTLIGVESQFDCMMLRKWGYENCVAMMGGGISKAQASMIAERCSTFIPLFDNDEGGRSATERARQLLKGRVYVVSVEYPNESAGKDPSEWGEALTKHAIESAGKIHIPRI